MMGRETRIAYGEPMASIDKFEDHCWKDVVPEADMRIYAPYARETAVGVNAALLCIDLYNQVYDGGARPPIEVAAQFPSSCGIYAHQAVEPTKRLIAAARRAGLPIFFCTQDVRSHARPAGAVSTKRRGRAMTADNYAIYKEFALRDTDIMIFKQRASAFQGTPIVSHLNVLGVQSLIVCGEATSGCVRASVVDAYSIGFNVALVEECTFDQTELTHKVNLFDMHHKYADVMHLAEVETHLDGLAQRAQAS
jgi:nicotinamidase-related amidase